LYRHDLVILLLSLYSQMGKHEKLDALVKEMKEKRINGDMYKHSAECLCSLFQHWGNG
jgi:pentatricopeptide repeat protein